MSKSKKRLEFHEQEYLEAVKHIHDLGIPNWNSGLDRFRELCRLLGNPQHKFKSILIGGTNGKGSTTAMVGAILQAADYRVGTYYSPYVYDFRERAQINNRMISKEDVIRLVNVIKPHAEALAETDLGYPSEYEYKTGLAFLYFLEQNVDFAVLEVGIGGRLDATSVVTPEVSVITNVSLDHTDRLGNTVAEIAGEKAGIIKESGHLVTASVDQEALSVMRRICTERHSDMWEVIQEGNRDYRIKQTIPINARERTYNTEHRVSSIEHRASSIEHPASSIEYPASSIQHRASSIEHPASSIEYRAAGDTFTVHGTGKTYTDMKVHMPGVFQETNAATSIAVIEALMCKNFEIQESAIRLGLESAFIPGRLEVLQKNPTVLIDGAHNPDSAQNLVHAIKTIFEYDRLILIMGMLSGHSIENVVGTLAPLADEFIATSPSDNPRAMSASEIAAVARRYLTHVKEIIPVKDAVSYALSSARENDLICVTGSFYTISEVSRPEE